MVETDRWWTFLKIWQMIENLMDELLHGLIELCVSVELDN
jgi:hypothetical protein